MKPNYRQIFARQKAEETKLRKLGYILPEGSGIYIFTRYDAEKGKTCVYIGQAKNLKRRIISHLTGYSQRIDVSLKKWGIAPKKPQKYDAGWSITIYYCTEAELNEAERHYIALYSQKENVELYNITGGGQDKGKVDINERKASKGYHDGLKQGELNAWREVADYFRYLKPTIAQRKKDGTPTAIATRKLADFLAKIKGNE